MRLDCGRCGSLSGEHNYTVEDTFTWRCPLCMTKHTHTGIKPKPKKKKKVKKPVEKIELKPDLMMED